MSFAKVLRMVRHADGTGTRLHECTMLRGSPRRQRRTWIVGMGVDAQGVAMNGGDCHGSLESAAEAFEREVERRGGAVAVALPGKEI